jgi:hypothetical protein
LKGKNRAFKLVTQNVDGYHNLAFEEGLKKGNINLSDKSYLDPKSANFGFHPHIF